MHWSIMDKPSEQKRITVIFNGKSYVWYKRKWIMNNNNLTIGTALAQKLDEYAVKNGYLEKSDFSPPSNKLTEIEITKTEPGKK